MRRVSRDNLLQCSFYGGGIVAVAVGVGVVVLEEWACGAFCDYIFCLGCVFKLDSINSQ